MDAPYSWHPGTGRIMSAWAVPVPLLPGEIFSSWLVRAALTQGCDPLVLTGELWPKWRIWTTDPDRGVSAERLCKLVNASGIEISAFVASSLRPIVSAVTTEPPDDLAVWPWMLALGSRNRKRHGGLQYCPTCLTEDRQPYYRTQWRLAWHIGCTRHGVSLIDRCPHCNACIEPHRLSAMDENVAICATCKLDLREITTLSVNVDAFAFQQAADFVVKQGQGHYGIDSLSSNEWFALSRYFVMLLRKVAIGKSNKLTAFTKALGVDVSGITSPATGLALELLPVQERAVLLAGVWQMLKAGPEHFLKEAKSASLTTRSLCEKNQSVPHCIQDIIHDLPDKFSSRKAKEKDGINHPRSRQAVMHMWARLQRKIGVEAK